LGVIDVPRRSEFMKVRRVATGHTAEGKSVIVSDTEVDGDTVGLLPGFRWHQLWGADRAPNFPDDGSRPLGPTFFPAVGGYRFMLLTLPPQSVPRPAPADRQAMLSELETTLPGLAAHMEANNPGMHTSDTIDFEYIISGEVWLELDDDVQVHLRAGDTVVQNGTRHAWRNKGDEPCAIVVFMIGVNRQPSGIDVARCSV
jgi:mannose-6-phosphate isomerase-like protein (cupin superfamily)